MAMISRFRFSLRAIFAAVALLALLAMYVATERRYQTALQKYEGVRAAHEANVVTTMDLCAESFALYLADSQRWLRSRQGAMRSHVERLKELERWFQAKIENGVSSDPFCEMRILEGFRTLRKRFEEEAQ